MAARHAAGRLGQAVSPWRAGDTVLMRDIDGDRVRHAVPCRAVRDESEVIVLYLAPGTRCMRPRGRRGGPRDRIVLEWDGSHEELVWSGEGKLWLFRPGDSHSIQVFWDNETREFLGWYVNLERHHGRTRFGYDIHDQVLDLIVHPDLETHEWKDEDEVAYLIEHGLVSASDAAAARAEGARVLQRARRRERPFNEDWPSWRADAAWPIPELPTDWARI